MMAMQSQSPAWPKYLALALLCLIFGQAAGSAARTSITIDEGLHVTSGYTIWRTGDFRLVEEHPPLVKLLEALPLLLVPDLRDPATLTGWESDVAVTDSVRLVRATQELIYPYEPIDRLVFAARTPTALLAVLLGALVFRWATDLGGWAGGLLALCLLAFDPNILAHAAVAGTDLGAACFITLALFALTRFLRRPTLSRLIVAGVTLGWAQGAKLSALILLPVVIGLGVLALPPRKWGRLLSLLLIAGLTLWAIYGFEVGAIPGAPFPVPAASHAIPWQRLRQHMADGHAAFLMGENSAHGWRHYFPLAFVLKTPLPTLILFAATAAIGLRKIESQRLWRRRIWADWRAYVIQWGALIVFPGVYAISSLFSNLNIGYRHLLPILPLLFVVIGSLAEYVVRHKERLSFHALRFMFFGLLAWLALGTLRIFPHYLAYFNELAGGPDNGYRYLADSNTDWGQAYKDLARFQRERGIGPVRLSAFIFYDPAIYGVAYEPLTPMRGDTPAVFPSRFDPPPGDYVISATTLDGIPLVDPEMYDWFRKREPDAKIGRVLFYYHVTEPNSPPTWAAQCTSPTAPLTPEEIAAGFGRDDLRIVSFDCAHSWIYPHGGQSAGWYVLFRGRETEIPFIQAHSAPARLAYEQQTTRGAPSFSIHEWRPDDAGEVMQHLQADAIIAAPAGQSPQTASESGMALSPPVAFSDTLDFLGYRAHAPRVKAGETWEVWTYWSVNVLPASPISLMAHLLGAEGGVLSVGDGLGTPVEHWRAEDVVVQRHLLDVPPDAAPGVYWLQSGVYTLADLKRLPILANGDPIADRLIVTEVEVLNP